jgi:hypothetical protein
LLTIVTLPLSVSAPDGLYCTPKESIWPAESVTGTPAPVSEKFVPLMLICETVTLALPVFVKDTSCEALLPALTLPKLRLLELMSRVFEAATLVALSDRFAGEFAALLTSESVPLTVPADCVVNCTLKVLFCPAATVRGRESPVVLNPAPLMFA